MFILLSEQQKKHLFREYRTRLFAVACFFLSAIFILSMGFLLPSYIALRAHQSELASENGAYQKQIEVKNGKGLTATLSDIKSMVAIIAPQNTNLLGTIEKILADKPARVTITTIGYAHSANASSTISLQGVAGSRSDLLAFSKALQKETVFGGVDLPVSSLAKDTNVPYSLGVSGKF